MIRRQLVQGSNALLQTGFYHHRVALFDDTYTNIKRFSTVHTQKGKLGGLYHEILKKGIELFLLYVGYMISVPRLPSINRTETGNEKVALG